MGDVWCVLIEKNETLGFVLAVLLKISLIGS